MGPLSVRFRSSGSAKAVREPVFGAHQAEPMIIGEPTPSLRRERTKEKGWRFASLSGALARNELGAIGSVALKASRIDHSIVA